jgi:hypothetical protein
MLYDVYEYLPNGYYIYESVLSIQYQEAHGIMEVWNDKIVYLIVYFGKKYFLKITNILK